MKRIALCCALFPFAAGAAPLELGAYGGVYAFDEARDVTTEATGAAPNNAALFGARAAYAPDFLLLDLELSADVLVGDLADGSSMTGLALRLEVRHAFTDAVLRPYLAMGPAVQVGFTEDYGTDADLAVTAGGGLIWDVADAWGLRFDVHWLGGDGVESIANDFLLTLGATYTLSE